jgi:hypothetical protein
MITLAVLLLLAMIVLALVVDAAALAYLAADPRGHARHQLRRQLHGNCGRRLMILSPLCKPLLIKCSSRNRPGEASRGMLMMNCSAMRGDHQERKKTMKTYGNLSEWQAMRILECRKNDNSLR